MPKFDREVGTTSIHLFSSCLPRPTHPSQPTAGQPACVNGVRERKNGLKAATALGKQPRFSGKGHDDGKGHHGGKGKGLGNVVSSSASLVRVTI